MPTPASQGAYSLEDFASLVAFLSGTALDFSVIGGSAVGMYARLRGQDVFSADLDLYTTASALYALVDAVKAAGVVMTKVPKPRDVPVAVVHWEGKEVNILSSSVGLPAPEMVLRLAREFHFQEKPDLSVLVADPLDLLSNKLAVNRPKDRSHVKVLVEFIEEEVVEAFEHETEPRKRTGPGNRYMGTIHSKTLPEALAARLLPLARITSDYFFLASAVPSAQLGQDLLARAPTTLVDRLGTMLSNRGMAVGQGSARRIK